MNPYLPNPPMVSITPPRATYLLTVHLLESPGRYRAYTTETADPEEWMRRWEEDWEGMAEELWGYRPPSAEAKPNSILAKLFPAIPAGFKRRV